VYGGQRTAVAAVVTALGASVRTTRPVRLLRLRLPPHPRAARPRSFATLRKIEVMREEANPDVVLTHDTGCVTTLDQSQFAAKAHDRKVGVPVMSEAQFAALAMGAHPYRVAQLHWHNTEYRPLLEKMGIDWRERWREFEDDPSGSRRATRSS
jgi:heterodisulfide reductase subunit B